MLEMQVQVGEQVAKQRVGGQGVGQRLGDLRWRLGPDSPNSAHTVSEKRTHPSAARCISTSLCDEK